MVESIPYTNIIDMYKTSVESCKGKWLPFSCFVGKNFAEFKRLNEVRLPAVVDRLIAQGVKAFCY